MIDLRLRLPPVALAAVAGVAAGFAASACRVPNPEHCTNQDQSGNDYCAGVNSATPFCSPCHEKNHGCLPFEPVSCDGYQEGSSGPGPAPESSSSG